MILKAKLKKNTKYIIMMIFLIVIFPVMFWIISININIPNKEDAEKLLKKDYTDIMIITNYLVNSSYSTIHFNSDTFHYNRKEINTDSEETAVLKALKRLFKKREYRVIYKNDNTICFEKWLYFTSSSGIAYSIIDSDKPTIDYLVNLEPLSKKGWYYYKIT